MRKQGLLAFFAITMSIETAGSEIFECVDSDGSIRFVNEVHDCNQAKPHPLKARVEKLSAPVDATEHQNGAPGDASLGFPGPRLEQLMPAQGDVGTDWSVVLETPIDPIQDPDLLRWGVRAQRSRHYTRSEYGAVQVCSVEIWAFEDIPHARTAHDNFTYPNWRIVREGPVLVMARALTQKDGNPEDRTLFPDCLSLVERVRVRAARIARD